ncbi:MAG TPA: LptA/OstA family protein [Sphingobium sp.]|uniref:LptA/OstA family protein n=1 Tax=Sphingobium sp. TaxID=1912891 RepID=UPI002ED4556C
MTRARKTALLTLAAAGAAALSFNALSVQAQVLKSHDSNAPVDFTADRIEVQDRSDRVVVSGNVQVTQGDMHLTSDRLTVAYTQGSGVEINRMDAVGNVIVTRGNEVAKGNVAIYDLDKKLITMLGNVQLTQGTSRLNGGRLLIDLKTGRSSVDGHAASGGTPGVTQSGGRVSGTFKVKQQQN